MRNEIILMVNGALMLFSFFINLLSPEGIPGGVLGILTWVAFIIFPIASGILFILAGRKKLHSEASSIAFYSVPGDGQAAIKTGMKSLLWP